ncbi:MAG: SWIM zinc finger family protein [Acidobacteria bacterium]|nr:SWIM zinc finger family protein [Acidobacteriota bacterium]
MSYYGYGWRPYVPVAERRRKAEREMVKRRKQGHEVSPVLLEGRAIATTFWGQAWCDNLERYSDYANRLPRGRTYVRNGSVVDLRISAGAIDALVMGSELYKVALKVTPVAKARWKAICGDCAGAIDSLVELLQGRFSKGVMERICRPGQGLFPSPAEIRLSCSCPDWADMCKHVAAVLYGVGARFDRQPELLFRLREVDEKDLIAKAGQALPLAGRGPAKTKLLAGEDLSAVFGLDLAQSADPHAKPAAKRAKPKKAAAPAGKRKPVKKTAPKPRRKVVKPPSA